MVCKCYNATRFTYYYYYYVIIGGDMNVVIDPGLTYLINNFALTDIWRLKNLTLKEFIFFSPRHHSSSRKDHICMSPEIVHLVQDFEIVHN